MKRLVGINELGAFFWARHLSQNPVNKDQSGIIGSGTPAERSICFIQSVRRGQWVGFFRGVIPPAINRSNINSAPGETFTCATKRCQK